MTEPVVTVHAAPSLSPAAAEALKALVDVAKREIQTEHPQMAGGWSQIQARAFNAVQPALRKAGEWLPLSARRAVANAVLAELLGPIPASTDTATWTAVRAIQLMNEAGKKRDGVQAEAKRLGLMVEDYSAGASALGDKLKRARDLHRETCPLARGAVSGPAFKCSMCEILDQPAATQATEPQEQQ
ncbi:hypothetical protein ACWD3J_14105 [Streptomyces sp. NPDC002755]